MRISGEGFFDLGGELEGEGVEALGEVANVLEEIVVGDEGGDGGEESGGGGEEGFGDAGSNGAKTGGTGGAEAGEGVNNAPDGAEEADEGSDACSGGEPGHAFFGAANFVGGGKLHGNGDGLQGFQFCWAGIGGGADLGLEFAVAGGVDVGEGRAGADESLRIGDTLGGSKNFEELIAGTIDAAEEAELLEDESPGDQGEEEQEDEDATSDQASLGENIKDVADEHST